jgi:hypothetical protein
LRVSFEALASAPGTDEFSASFLIILRSLAANGSREV